MSWNVSPNTISFSFHRDNLRLLEKIWNIPLWPLVSSGYWHFWLAQHLSEAIVKCPCQPHLIDMSRRRYPTLRLLKRKRGKNATCMRLSNLHAFLPLQSFPTYSHNYGREGSMNAPVISTWRLIAECRAVFIKSIQFFEHFRRQREFGLANKNAGSGGKKSFWRLHLNSKSTVKCSAVSRGKQHTIWFSNSGHLLWSYSATSIDSNGRFTNHFIYQWVILFVLSLNTFK